MICGILTLKSKYSSEYIMKEYFLQKGLTMADENIHTEEFQVNGEELIAKIKGLLHEGNIRRVLIRNEEGNTLIVLPLTLGVVGALLAPQLAALGAIAALLTKGTIVVERVSEE
jgi:hypothetical protein